MINTPRDRTRPTDTDAVLELITPIIDRSGIVHTLESAAEPKSAAGAPTRHGQYTARGVLIAMFHAAYAGRPASIAELIALIWMSSNRSRDEGFNSILTSTEGGNLQDRTLYARRNPQVSLTIAFAVARANIKIQERWRETLRRNGGKAPREPQLGSDSTVDRRMPATRRRKTSTGGRKAA